MKRDLLLLTALIAIAGSITQIPFIFDITPDAFYFKSISFIVFPFLSVFFLQKQGASLSSYVVPSLAVLISAVYVAFLPDFESNDSVTLAIIHLPILFWALLGYEFGGSSLKTSFKTVEYLRYNGDLVVISAILFLSGLLFSAVTLGLFSLLDLNIEVFYVENIAPWGLAAIPIVGTALIQHNPELIGKVSPIIARIFTPIVFVMLLIFSVALLFSSKNLYLDREFLMIFNLLLIGVMAIILFSLSEIQDKTNSNFHLYVLTALSILTLFINLYGLSAILYRIMEFGITPNRLAVSVANALILIHLLTVTLKLIQKVRGQVTVVELEKTIAKFIPIYGIWALLVVFGFPLIFRT